MKRLLFLLCLWPVLITAAPPPATEVTILQSDGTKYVERKILGSDHENKLLGFNGSGVLGPISAGAGSGDMLLSVYDSNEDGIFAVAALDPLLLTEAEAAAAYQPLDADLTTLAGNDGSALTGLNGTSVASGTVADARIASTLTRDGEWDSIAEIETATTVNIVIVPEIDTLAEVNTLIGDGDFLSVAAAAAGYQPLDSDLTAVAALTTTAHGLSLLDDADAAASRASIGAVIGTNVQAWDADLDTWATKTPTTVGSNLVTLTNPGAVRFITINADNSVTARSAANFRSDIDAQQLNSTLTTLSGYLPTTAGINFLTLPNPGAITWPRINADNSITTLSAANTFQALADSASTTQGAILYNDGSDWVALSPGTAGHVLQTGGAGANPSWVAAGSSSGTVVKYLSADTATTTSSTCADAFGVALAANKTYHFRFKLLFTSSTTTEGQRFEIDGPGGTTMSYLMAANNTTSAESYNYATAYNSQLASPTGPGSGIVFPGTIEGIITTTGTTGNLMVQFGTETNAGAPTSNLKAGSSVELREASAY